MKKILAALLAFFASGVVSASAFASEPYLSYGAGSVWFNELKTNPPQFVSGGMNMDFAVGLRSGNYRVELDDSAQANLDGLLSVFVGYVDVLSVSALMLNGYYDFTPHTGFLRPYVTAGAGVADVGINNLSIWTNRSYSADHRVFGYQIGGGFLLPVIGNFDLDFRYRYLSTSKVHDTTIGDFDVASQSVLLGLQCHF